MTRKKFKRMSPDSVRFVRRWWHEEQVRFRRDLIRARIFEFVSLTPQAPRSPLG